MLVILQRRIDQQQMEPPCVAVDEILRADWLAAPWDTVIVTGDGTATTGMNCGFAGSQNSIAFFASARKSM
jgi:hypothetical protein